MGPPRAVEVAGGDQAALNYAGSAFEAKADHTHAIADLSRAIQITPQNPDAFYDRGLAHRAKGDRKSVV